jgi:serine phosphatase RsbU (regulator of sigma subunit)
VTNTLQAGLAAADGPALLAQNLQAAHDAWSAFARQQLDRVASGDLDGARTVAATGQGKALFDNIRARDEAVASWLAAASASTDQQASALRQRLMALLVLALITLVGVVAGGCYVLWTAVARPLARLAAATRAVVGGDLAADLPAVGAVEVRSLSRGVGAMRDRLTADLHTTRKSLEALEQTEPTVAALRTALRPFNEHVPGLTVQARLDPAEGVLAGDWYDTIALDSSRLGLVLGDVAGHGPAAAVFALRLKHSLITALRAGLDPGQALTQAITYANAGHPAGLLLDGIAAAGDPGHASRQTTRLFLDGEHPATWMELPSTGPLLSSIVIGWAWNTSTEDFCPGDTLLTFTDGVLETRNQDGEEFGTHGILDTVTAVGTNDGHRLIEAIAAASMRFGGNRPRRDDHTLVYLHRVTRQPHTDTTRPTAPR